MKKIAIAIGVVAVGLTIWFMPQKEVYMNPEIIEKVVEREVNPLDEQIKQRENELEEKYSKIKSLEARRDVLEAERDRLDAEVTSINKELAGFMTATSSGR